MPTKSTISENINILKHWKPIFLFSSNGDNGFDPVNGMLRIYKAGWFIFSVSIAFTRYPGKLMLQLKREGANNDSFISSIMRYIYSSGKISFIYKFFNKNFLKIPQSSSVAWKTAFSFTSAEVNAELRIMFLRISSAQPALACLKSAMEKPKHSWNMPLKLFWCLWC